MDSLNEGLEVLALVTARGGSKELPRKNVAPLCGKPLIAWTIEATFQSEALDRIVVSTDDEKIAQVSRQYGAEVPFMRPAELALDDSAHIDVVLHAVEWLAQHDRYEPDYVMLLQPTSPLRRASDIRQAVALAVKNHAPGVIGLVRTDNHPYWLKTVAADGSIQPFMEPPAGYWRRQDLPPVYRPNGAIYLVRRDVLVAERSLCPKGSLAYTMPKDRSLDVDDAVDLQLAELLLKQMETNEAD